MDTLAVHAASQGDLPQAIAWGVAFVGIGTLARRNPSPVDAVVGAERSAGRGLYLNMNFAVVVWRKSWRWSRSQPRVSLHTALAAGTIYLVDTDAFDGH